MPGAPNPTLITLPWASSASSTYKLSPIPNPSQQPNPRASYTDGFPPQTTGAGGTPPDIRDFNGVLADLSSNIVAWTAGENWGFEAAVAEEDEGYAGGAIIATADGSGFWLNINSAGNSNNPDTSPAATSGWVPVSQYGIGAVTGLTNANVTLSAAQAGKSIITLAGALTGNVQIIFPAWMKQWLVVNNTTGSYVVTCKTASGTGVAVSQGQATQLWGDGTNLNPVVPGTIFQTAANASSIAVGQTYYISKNGVTARTNTTTQAADPDLQFTNVPAGTYDYELTFYAYSSAAGYGISAYLAIGAGAVNFLTANQQATNYSGFNSNFAVQTSSIETLQLDYLGGNPDLAGWFAVMRVTGKIQTTALQSLELTWAQNVSSANTASVGYGSFKLTRLL